MSAAPHHPLCDSTCVEMARFRDDMETLYHLNLADFIVEAISLFVLLVFCCQRRAAGVLLLLILVADVVLESLAIDAASRMKPTATKVLEAGCFKLLQEPPERDSLLALESDCDAIVLIGVVQLLLAVFATLGDARDMFDWGDIRGDVDKKPLLIGVNSCVLFGPAVLDFILASLDFLIFTRGARAETEALATRSAAGLFHPHRVLH